MQYWAVIKDLTEAGYIPLCLGKEGECISKNDKPLGVVWQKEFHFSVPVVNDENEMDRENHTYTVRAYVYPRKIENGKPKEDAGRKPMDNIESVHFSIKDNRLAGWILTQYVNAEDLRRGIVAVENTVIERHLWEVVGELEHSLLEGLELKKTRKRKGK